MSANESKYVCQPITLREKITEVLRDNPHLHVNERANLIIKWFSQQLDLIEMDDDTGYRDPRTSYDLMRVIEELIGLEL